MEMSPSFWNPQQHQSPCPLCFHHTLFFYLHTSQDLFYAVVNGMGDWALWELVLCLIHLLTSAFYMQYVLKKFLLDLNSSWPTSKGIPSMKCFSVNHFHVSFLHVKFLKNRNHVEFISEFSVPVCPVHITCICIYWMNEWVSDKKAEWGKEERRKEEGSLNSWKRKRKKEEKGKK